MSQAHLRELFLIAKIWKNAFLYLCSEMKIWLTAFLLLVSITATFYPCCSEEKCEGEELTSTQASHDNQKEDGTCSPFINCGNCPGFVQCVRIAAIPQINEDAQVHHPKFISIKLSTYQASLLQPPRLA